MFKGYIDNFEIYDGNALYNNINYVNFVDSKFKLRKDNISNAAFTKLDEYENIESEQLLILEKNEDYIFDLTNASNTTDNNRFYLAQHYVDVGFEDGELNGTIGFHMEKLSTNNTGCVLNTNKNFIKTNILFTAKCRKQVKLKVPKS